MVTSASGLLVDLVHFPVGVDFFSTISPEKGKFSTISKGNFAVKLAWKGCCVLEVKIDEKYW